jgi:hypothetical protein
MGVDFISGDGVVGEASIRTRKHFLRQLQTSKRRRRSRKYLDPVLLGMLLSSGRRTVSSWLRAVGVGDDWRDHYYFLQTLGRAAGAVSRQLLLVALHCIPRTHVGEYVRLAIDDSPTKRYGPHVEAAGIHHNPTPGPVGAEYLYGHVWVLVIGLDSAFPRSAYSLSFVLHLTRVCCATGDEL